MERFIDAPDRFTLWEWVVQQRRPRSAAEIGVMRGEFAARLLAASDAIASYYMVDPWRHLDDWNKPANKDQDQFDQVFNEAMKATEFAADRRIVLRGTTLEVIDQIPDQSLDFAYIDGDHTLRGITIDLIRVWPKMKPGALLAGDDLSPTIWQHATNYEPTMVFPVVVHFAEAKGAEVWCLPYNQFALEIPGTEEPPTFRCHDLIGHYSDTSVLAAMQGELQRRSRRSAKQQLATVAARAKRGLR